jgi:adenylate kinase family enzyme
MSKTPIIIITGLAGTGKTTLAEKLAKEFNLPFVYKDYFKELIFDGLGWQDREWSKKVGNVSYDLLYFFVESLLKTKKPFIVETNFRPKSATEKFLDLKKKYDFTPIQIRCITDGKILLDRFTKRANSPDRHPGHIDSENLEEFTPTLLQGKIEALDIGGELFDIDTTDFDKVDYDGLVKAISLMINTNLQK